MGTLKPQSGGGATVVSCLLPRKKSYVSWGGGVFFLMEGLFLYVEAGLYNCGSINFHMWIRGFFHFMNWDIFCACPTPLHIFLRVPMDIAS